MSTVQSGIDMLPFIISLVVASVLAGSWITRTGYYAPCMIVGPIFISIEASLITTLVPNSSSSMWISYQIIFGLGIGLGMQQPAMAAQTMLTQPDVPVGASLMNFVQQLGCAIFMSVG